MTRRRLLVPVLLTLLAAPCLAQDLVGRVNERLSGKPDAVDLLRRSAAVFESAPQAEFNLVNTIDVVAGARENTQQQVYSVRLAAGDKYAVELVKPTNEFWVKSDGKQTMTYVQPLAQYSMVDQAGGVGAFAGSDLAGMLGSGFGSLVFSLFDSETTDTVLETITDSTYLGEVSEDDQKLHHCRYVAEGMTWDAWFTADDTPRLMRVKPDLTEVAAKAPAAEQFDNFSFNMKFDVKDFEADAELPADTFALDPPAGADKVKDALSPPEPPPHRLLGQKAPLFDATNPAGEPIDLGVLIGKKVIILDFWATWCGPCVAAMPKLDAVADRYADKGVVLYAVNQGEDAETVNAFLQSKNLDVLVAMDSDGQAAQEYSIEGLPTTVVVGKDGRVQVVHVGFSQNLDIKLSGELDALLAGQNLAAEVIAKWNEEHPNRPVGGKRAAAPAN